MKAINFDPKDLAMDIAKVLYDKKALDITVLDVSSMTVITDYMVIASGRSAIQVKALADDVDDAMAEKGAVLRAKEGNGEGRWIVLDYNHVMVHIFHPEDRKFYHLERLWDDGKNHLVLDFPEDQPAE